MRNIGVYIAVALTGCIFVFFTLFSLEEPPDAPAISFDFDDDRNTGIYTDSTLPDDTYAVCIDGMDTGCRIKSF